VKPVNVAPSRPVDGGHKVYAADQPEYQPLPAWVRQDGRVVTRWRLSWRERVATLFGRDLYVEVLTFNGPLQPMYPSWDERDIFGWGEEMADE
jgi:hypothetical protein